MPGFSWPASTNLAEAGCPGCGVLRVETAQLITTQPLPEMGLGRIGLDSAWTGPTGPFPEALVTGSQLRRRNLWPSWQEALMGGLCARKRCQG